MARPSLKPTAEQWPAILASAGKTETQIAAVIGISRMTLRKHFAEELVDAHAHEVRVNLKRLQKAAGSGSIGN
jgi:predicted transcriptional regulator